MQRVNIKVLSQKTLPRYIKWIILCYDPEKKHTSDYKRCLKNSPFVVIALINNQVMGVCRILTDLDTSAFLVELFVDPALRNEWIWKLLIQGAVNFCMKKNIHNIELITDPKYPRLVKFYEKLGFESSPKYGTYMSFNKKKIILNS